MKAASEEIYDKWTQGT